MLVRSSDEETDSPDKHKPPKPVLTSSTNFLIFLHSFFLCMSSLKSGRVLLLLVVLYF